MKNILQNRVKPTLACLLAAMLAGCAPAPAGGAPAPQTAETAPAAQTEAEAETAPPLQRLTSADETGYVQCKAITDADGQFWGQLWVTDFSTGRCAVPCPVEGCPHTTADCPGVLPWLYTGEVLILNEDTLLYTGSEQFCVSGRNGEDFRTLLPVYSPAPALYTDDRYLYLLNQLVYPRDTPVYQLLQVDPATGSSTVLGSCRGDLADLYAAGRTLVVTLYGYDPYAASTSSSVTLQQRIAWDLDTGAQRTLESPVFDTETAVGCGTVGDTIYAFDPESRVLTGYGLLDGARRLQSDPFPAPVYEAPADENLSAVRRLGDWLELEYSCFSRDRSEQTSFSYLVELKTGQVRRKPDLPELVWNGYGHQPTVYAQLQDRLLVDCRAEPYDYVEYGQDGAPYTIHSDRRYLGLITYEDYLSGTPDYTMLEAFN